MRPRSEILQIGELLAAVAVVASVVFVGIEIRQNSEVQIRAFDSGSRCAATGSVPASRRPSMR